MKKVLVVLVMAFMIHRFPINNPIKIEYPKLSEIRLILR